MRKKIIFFIIILLLFGGIFLYVKRSKGNNMDTIYRTQRVINSQLRIAVSATGTLNPVRVVNVGTQISGTIKEIYVDFNDRVTEGQILLKLDDELYKAKVKMSEANLDSTKAQLKLSQIKYDRQKTLSAKGTASKEELDTAIANLDMDKAKVAQALASLEQDLYNLNNTTIISPVDGVVINKAVDIGQTVAASFQTPTLIDIAQDLSKMQINASFAEADIGRLTSDLLASFTVDAYPGINFEGKLRQIRLNPTITSNVVTYDVVVDVSNPELILLPGMTAYVDIELYREDNVLLVPNTALNYRPLPENNSGVNTPFNSEAQASVNPPLNPKSSVSDPSLNGAPSDTENNNGEELNAPGDVLQKDPVARIALGLPSKDDPPTKGRVYVLAKDNKPMPVDLLLGATDLRFTVVRGGNLKPGDEVITAENSATTEQTTIFGAPPRR
jgi:HlyD family secretion protein